MHTQACSLSRIRRGMGEEMAGARSIPVLVYGAEAAAIEDFQILFGSVREEPGLFEGLGPAFEAELYRSIYADPDFPRVELTAVAEGRAALEAVGRALAKGRPFQVAFIDLGPPPGNWGLDVAAGIRGLDPYLHIVLMATRCDLSPTAICARIPPADRLCLLSKPFKPLEVLHQVLAARARGRAVPVCRLPESWARAADTGQDAMAGPAAGVRAASAEELGALVPLLRSALEALQDELRPPVSTDRLQPRPPGRRESGRPAHGLAEEAARFDTGEDTGAPVEPVARRKRRRGKRPGPEKIADV